MIKSKLCLAALGVITDAETKQVSAFGVIEDVQAPSFPATLSPMVLVTLWERTNTDASQWNAQLSVSLNDQQLIAGQSIPIDFAQLLRTRSNIRLEGLPVAGPGRLVLRLAIAGHDSAEWVIQVSLAAPVALAATGAGYAAANTVQPKLEPQPLPHWVSAKTH